MGKGGCYIPTAASLSVGVSQFIVKLCRFIGHSLTCSLDSYWFVVK